MGSSLSSVSLSRLEYNGWPGWERRVPVAEVANLWAAPRLFRDLRAEEKCIALNKFMARPRLWSTRSSWRAPRRVSRIEILFSSFRAVVSLFPRTERRRTLLQKRRSRLDTSSIYFLFVKSSLRPSPHKYIEPNMRQDFLPWNTLQLYLRKASYTRVWEVTNVKNYIFPSDLWYIDLS